MTTDAVPALERESQEMAVLVQGLTVHDPESYAAAGEWIKTVAAYLKKVNELMGPIVEANHRAHKVAVQQRDALLRPAEGCKRILGDRMAAWDQRQADLRREAEAAARREQARLEHEAREQAEAEQRRLQREAETRRLEEAALMEQAGDRAGASRLLDAPVPVPVVTPAPVFVPAPPPPMAPKVEGVSYRDVWEYEITDPALLPREYLMPDEKRIGSVVRAMRAETQIPGVRAYARRTTAVRAGG